MLYVVATPIGNLKDITLRALEVLNSADFIIAENPRNSLKLLTHYNIKGKKIMQFAEHNEKKVLSTIIHQLSTQTGALISDAGTPGISDPGFRLIRACVREDIAIIPIPGPSAEIAGLSASGLPTDKFLFVGFLPRKELQLIKALKDAESTKSTLVGFDSPFRIKKTVGLIAKHFPKCKVVVAREITKLHEEFIRGNAEIVAQVLLKRNNIKGEITVLVTFKDFDF